MYLATLIVKLYMVYGFSMDPPVSPASRIIHEVNERMRILFVVCTANEIGVLSAHGMEW